MKKAALSFLVILLIYSPCHAKDFIVEFIEENYKEIQQPYSNDPLIYHSIQVGSSAGPKLLILLGSNFEYRRWLRQYIAENKTLIAKVEEEEKEIFFSSSAYEIDVTNLHPMNGEKWVMDLPTSPKVSTLQGKNHILVLDTDEKRSRMISTVVQHMGYSAMVLPRGDQALEILTTQPEQIKMVIVTHEIQDLQSQEIVDQILNLETYIPILVETGYQNPKVRDLFESRFSSTGYVTIKPVALEDLQNTIKKLVKEKA